MSKSSILKAVRKIAKSLYAKGLMNEKTMRKFDLICSPDSKTKPKRKKLI